MSLHGGAMGNFNSLSAATFPASSTKVESDGTQSVANRTYILYLDTVSSGMLMA